MKKFIVFLGATFFAAFLCLFYSEINGQDSCHVNNCTAKPQDVLVGKSFWTYDKDKGIQLFNHGAMAKHDTLRVTAPSTASRDTLQPGYYPAIILIPEEE